jgi:hypothetical protein
MGGGVANEGRQHARHNSDEPMMYLPSRGQINYQNVLREQGVLFSDGVQPRNNILDSPMTAWHDMMSDHSSTLTETLQIIATDDEMAESSAQGAARARSSEVSFSPNDIVARAVILNFHQPNIFIGATSLRAATFPSLSLIKTIFSSKSNDVEEASVMGRRVARKLCFDGTPASDNFAPADYLVSGNSSVEVMKKSSKLVVKATRVVRKKEVQITTAVRRSPRNNIYNGFKVDMPSDTRKRKSKVLNRVIPDASLTPVKDTQGVHDKEVAVPPVPPPTPVPILQKIGVKICAIPSEELTDDKLLKADSDEEP